jgi:putative ABC transport system permease protein
VTNIPGLRRVFTIVSPRTHAPSIDREFEFHIECRAEELMARGASRVDALTIAKREFGDVARYHRDVLTIDQHFARELRMRELAASAWSDVRQIIRALARTPGFLLLTVLTLALGIGATTALFSVVDGVLLEPLPYPRSARIVQLFQIDKNGKRMSVSVPNFRDWQRETRSFSAMAVSHPPGTVTVNGLHEPLRATAAEVSGDFFSVFDLRPQIGRVFAADDLHSGAAPTAVVSDAFWRRYLDADPAAVGHPITIGATVFTVIGVMPPEMNYPAGNELWIPVELDVSNSGSGRTTHGWRVVGRLRDGVSTIQAKQDLSSVSRRLKQQYGDATWMVDGDLVPLHEQLVGNVRTTILVLFGAAALLLLIAWTNVVNLMVARMTLRHAEIGVRLALGATRVRLAQQFLIEAGVLSALAALIGIALGTVGVRVLLAMQTSSLPRADEIKIDWRVLAFAVGVSFLTAVALGLFAVWQGTRGDIREALASSQRTQAGSGSTARVRQALVVSQVALTMLLLVGAGLLARSFVRLLEVNPGFRTQHVVVLDLDLPYESGSAAHRRREAFFEQVMERARTIPGVARVGVATGVPLANGGADGTYLIRTRADEPLTPNDRSMLEKDPTRSGAADFRVVDGDYFRAMGIPLLRGRLFDSGDGPDATRVALISASLASAKWRNENPIGKLIEFGMDGDLRPFTVVGIVGDVRGESLAAEPSPTFYARQSQTSYAGNAFSVVLQVAGDPTSVIALVRAIAREMRPDVPAVFRTMESVVSASVADRRFVLVLVAVFGGAALVLATLGVYGLISYLVTQRRREIAVRIALGAQRGDVVRLVLGQGGALALVGILAGGGAALMLTRLLKGLVYGVSTTDPLTFVGTIALLSIVALLASWLPARRASSVDPVEALRGE